MSRSDETATEWRLRPRRLRIDRSRAAAIGGLRTWIGKWRRSEAGVSAVEFALVAPILFFALVAAADVGLAEYERMTIDHVLRAGAQSAMMGQRRDQVSAVVQNTASKNFTLANQTTASADAPGVCDITASASALSVCVIRLCACPENTSAAVACSTTCASAAPTFIYYRLSGTKIHNGMIMPAVTLSPSVEVQAR